MTVSPASTLTGAVPADPTDERALTVLGQLVPREAPDAAPGALAQRVRLAVASVRRAVADGSLHHHRPEDVPAGVRSRTVDVVRAWATGAGPEAQRRACGVCSPGAR